MKNKSTFTFITVLMSLLVIYALVTNVFLPVFTQNKYIADYSSSPKNEDAKTIKKKKSGSANSEVSTREEHIPDSLKFGNSHQGKEKLFDLKKREKFLQAKLSLVNDDSMYLVLNLEKKTAVLELKGVPLHEAKILNYHVSNTLKNQPEDALVNWISKPFFLKEDSATIPKISYIVKIAPKDTIEANKYEVLPAPPKRGDVYVVMDFERGLRLIIRQSEKPDDEGKKNISRLKWNYTKDEFTKSLDALIHFDRKLEAPTVDITLPKADALILYRALPYRPKLLFYF